jgi:hypothetical protein
VHPEITLYYLYGVKYHAFQAPGGVKYHAFVSNFFAAFLSGTQKKPHGWNRWGK